MELTQVQFADLTLRIVCFGSMIMYLTVSIFSWSLSLRDFAVALSFGLVYCLLKVFLTAIDIALPE